jgi:hypothetical protein
MSGKGGPRVIVLRPNEACEGHTSVGLNKILIGVEDQRGQLQEKFGDDIELAWLEVSSC